MAVISTPMVTPSSTLDLTHDDQRRALFAGLAYLGLLITGALGYMFVRGKLFVDHDAARTAANLVGAALTQALVAVTFFALFRRMHRWAAASITAFGLLSAAALMTAAVFSWSALDAALGGSAHDAQLLYRLQGTSWDVGGIFFGRVFSPRSAKPSNTSSRRGVLESWRLTPKRRTPARLRVPAFHCGDVC